MTPWIAGLLFGTAIYYSGCDREDRTFVAAEHIENGMFVKEHQDEGLSIKVEMSPRLSILGENRLFITVKDRAGIPIEDAHLNLSSTSTMPGMKIEWVEINHGSGGVYEAKLHYISVGQWKLILRTHRFGKKEIKDIFLFDVIGHA